MNALTMRDAQRAYDRMLPPEIEPEPLSDTEITDALATAGVDDSILEAAVYAVRNQDFGYLVRQYERLAGPVVREAMAERDRRAEGDAAEARDDYRRDAA